MKIDFTGGAYWILIIVILALVMTFAITAMDISCFAYSLLGEGRKFEVLKFLGLSMGGILLALQAVVSHKRARAMENAANAQAGATEQQAIANRHSERGQRQDRLGTAIEHLGSQNMSIRVGARYELLGLAEDTEELRKVVLDILCAYIRETTKDPQYRKNYQKLPSNEIQDLTRLLFMQNHEVFRGLHIDLEGSWLNGVNLHQAKLTKVNLQNAVMQGAVLARAQMQCANLAGAHLDGAIAESAILHGSLLLGTKWEGANVNDAQMQGSILSRTDFDKASLSGTNLMGITVPPTSITSQGLSLDFVDIISRSTNRQSDLSGIIFSSVINLQNIQNMVQNRGAIIGAYTEAEAQVWIERYNNSMFTEEMDH